MLYLAYILMLVGTIWLVITAVQVGQTTGEKVLWAIVNLLCQPLGGIIFFIVKKAGMVPLILVLIGWAMFVFGGGMAAYQNMAPVTP
jgi:cytochrome c oxidase assembly factor CtaG